MARTQQAFVQNQFVRGLITEASPLNFPEDACTETFNCVFGNLGDVTRRLGFEFENQSEGLSTDLEGCAITSFHWKNAGGEGGLSFVVLQIGDTLHFYRTTAVSSLSSNKHPDTIDLSDFFPPGVTTVKSLECQYASGNGLLFVTNEQLESFYVEYSVSGDNITATQIDLKIRDTVGDTEDSLATDERPTAGIADLTPFHRYNLENQGWTATSLASWDTARTDMPSNADVSWYFKQAEYRGDLGDALDFSIVANAQIGNSPAPKGHFIFSLYDQNRSSITTGATDTDLGANRVSTCAFFAGRVFYSGLKTSVYNSRIFFSQVAEDKTQYGRCHQLNDPTSEALFDLLPTDGGVIDILEAGPIIKMVPLLNTLLVFATNGIWAITGSQGLGFTANDYSISRIASIENTSASSFVDVDGVPFWWTLEGIYTVSLDNNNIRVVSLTDSTIANFFSQIPVGSIRYVKGAYDSDDRIIQWVFRSVAPDSFNERYIYDKLLNFNVLSKSFYPWEVSTNSVKIHSVIPVSGIAASLLQETVTDSAVTVTDGGEDVTAFVSSEDSSGDVGVFFKYVVSYVDVSTFITFAECNQDSNLDWVTETTTGESYDSYFVTGYAIHGKVLNKFQTNYLMMYLNNSVDSSFKIRNQWNFSTSGSSGKWSASQTFSSVADDFSHKVKKIKLRGHGLVNQLRIENNGNDPFHFIGWGIWETANQRI